MLSLIEIRRAFIAKLSLLCVRLVVDNNISYSFDGFTVKDLSMIVVLMLMVMYMMMMMMMMMMLTDDQLSRAAETTTGKTTHFHSNHSQV